MQEITGVLPASYLKPYQHNRQETEEQLYHSDSCRWAYSFSRKAVSKHSRRKGQSAERGNTMGDGSRIQLGTQEEKLGEEEGESWSGQDTTKQAMGI